MAAFCYKNLMTWMRPVHSRDQAEIHFRNQKWRLCLYVMLPLMQVAGEEVLLWNYTENPSVTKARFLSWLF